MKLLRLLPIIILFAAFTACEKAVIDDEDNNDKTEKPIEKPDNPNSDGNNDNPGDGDSDNSGDDSDGDDTIVDPDDDSDKNTEEGDIVDGNDPDKGDSEIGTGDVISVTDFINKSLSGGVWVEEYIVGSCTRNISNADFTAPFSGASALLLADDPEETNTDNVIAIELKSGSNIRKAANLEDHPENKGKRLKVFGYRENYLGIIGIKNISSNMFELFN